MINEKQNFSLLQVISMAQSGEDAKAEAIKDRYFSVKIFNQNTIKTHRTFRMCLEDQRISGHDMNEIPTH